MAVTTSLFGRTAAGEPVTAYRITNSAGASLSVLDYGATVQSLSVPNKQGGLTDVVLGYDSLAQYETSSGYLGATIGRVGNRIGGARFSLNGVEHVLAKNNGENHLHGGIKGFDKYIWQSQVTDGAVRFSRLSPDGEEGYPGNLSVSVTFALTEEPAFIITYDAATDKDTPVNLTNHTYYNLSGGGSVLDHELQLFAQRFCENDDGCLPTGKLLEVEGTPFDFRQPKPIGRDIEADCEQLRRGKGYDYNFCLGGRQAAVLYSAQSGIQMTVETDMPGVQVYSANGLTDRPGKNGSTIHCRDALCLETQLWPNAMACYGFPSPILRAGKSLHSQTAYRFFVR